MRVAHRPRLPDVRQMLRLAAVEPGGRRRILYPGVIWAGVISDLVLNDFDAHLVRSINQLAKLRQVSEMLFDAIEIDGAVTMIVGDLSFRTAWLIGILLALIEMVNVVIPWRKPDR